MVKKDATYKWDERENVAFSCIKRAIIEAPIMYSPDFNKDLFMNTFASDTSLAAVLTQKDGSKQWATYLFRECEFAMTQT